MRVSHATISHTHKHNRFPHSCACVSEWPVSQVAHTITQFPSLVAVVEGRGWVVSGWKHPTSPPARTQNLNQSATNPKTDIGSRCLSVCVEVNGTKATDGWMANSAAPVCDWLARSPPPPSFLFLYTFSWVGFFSVPPFGYRHAVFRTKILPCLNLSFRHTHGRLPLNDKTHFFATMEPKTGLFPVGCKNFMIISDERPRCTSRHHSWHFIALGKMCLLKRKKRNHWGAKTPRFTGT